MSEESHMLERIAAELADTNKHLERLREETSGVREAISVLSDQLHQSGEQLANELGNVATAGEAAGEKLRGEFSAIGKSLKAIAEGEASLSVAVEEK